MKSWSFALALASAATIFGCASTKLEPGAAEIPITINAELVKGCKFLGEVKASIEGNAFQEMSAVEEAANGAIRNQALSKGANIILLSPSQAGTRSGEFGGGRPWASQRGEAYFCSSPTPSSTTKETHTDPGAPTPNRGTPSIDRPGGTATAPPPPPTVEKVVVNVVPDDSAAAGCTFVGPYSGADCPEAIKAERGKCLAWKGAQMKGNVVVDSTPPRIYRCQDAPTQTKPPIEVKLFDRVEAIQGCQLLGPIDAKVDCPRQYDDSRNGCTLYRASKMGGNAVLLTAREPYAYACPGQSAKQSTEAGRVPNAWHSPMVIDTVFAAGGPIALEERLVHRAGVFRPSQVLMRWRFPERRLRPKDGVGSCDCHEGS